MQDEILRGWKEIAVFLAVSVSTAQKMERQGLPVSRPMGRGTSPVIAVADAREWLLRN